MRQHWERAGRSRSGRDKHRKKTYNTSNALICAHGDLANNICVKHCTGRDLTNNRDKAAGNHCTHPSPHLQNECIAPAKKKKKTLAAELVELAVVCGNAMVP